MTDAELVKQVKYTADYGIEFNNKSLVYEINDECAEKIISLVKAQRHECTICGSTDMFNDKLCYSSAETHYS